MSKTFTPTKAQQQSLVRLLQETAEPTPAQVSQIAQTVLLADQTGVEAYISDYLRRRRQDTAWAAQAALRKFMVLYQPIPKDAQPEVVWTGPNGEVMKRKVTRQAVTVYVKDLESFCAERRLNRDRVMQVALGEIPEVKGYSRADKHSPLGNSMCLGRPYQAPQEEKKTLLNPDPRYKPPVQWTPAQEKKPILYIPSQSSD